MTSGERPPARPGLAGWGPSWPQDYSPYPSVRSGSGASGKLNGG